MSAVTGGTIVHVRSRVLARSHSAALPAEDRAVARRIAVIWFLLFLNVLSYEKASSNLLPLPSFLGKLITEGAVFIALMIVVTINRRLVVRPNAFLLFLSVLGLLGMILSVHGNFGYGSIIRAVRFLAVLAVLWLLTPWWGRRDLLLTRWHFRALGAILAVVVLGLAIAPGKSFAQAGGGRLGGSIWPIPPDQVAHFAAVFAGLAVIFWFAGQISGRLCAVLAVGGIAILLLSHTRTGVIALLIAIFVAALSLFLERHRVRKALMVTAIVGALLLLTISPLFATWFNRAGSSGSISNLSGRSTVWSQMVSQPRSEVNTLFGYGPNNDSFDGQSIDNSWLATFQSAGLFGDALLGLSLVALLVLALMAPRGPGRAIALFLLAFCAVSSFTETGLGEASAYTLDLAVAMSAIMPMLPLRAPELAAL
jgi:O-antigen ligase